MVLHARLSNLCNKMKREMATLTELDNLHISLKQKNILPKNYPVVFCHTLPCHEYMSQHEFSTLAAKLRMV